MFDLQGFFSPLSKIGISYKVKKDVKLLSEPHRPYNKSFTIFLKEKSVNTDFRL